MRRAGQADSEIGSFGLRPSGCEALPLSPWPELWRRSPSPYESDCTLPCQPDPHGRGPLESNVHRFGEKAALNLNLVSQDLRTIGHVMDTPTNGWLAMAATPRARFLTWSHHER